MVIPSLTSPPGVFPSAEIARAVNAVGKAMLVPTPEALCDHVIRADKSMLAPSARVAEQHVLILDDIWTTGSTPSRQR